MFAKIRGKSTLSPEVFNNERTASVVACAKVQKETAKLLQHEYLSIYIYIHIYDSTIDIHLKKRDISSRNILHMIG
jgi:hypothetical protein